MHQDNTYLKYIGLITVKNLTGFTQNARYSKVRCVLLNQRDMDRLAMEIRETYRDNFFEPYILNGVRIKEDYERSTPQGKIRVVLKS